MKFQMKTIVLFIIIIFYSSLSQAQSVITGLIVGPQNEPLAYANVLLLSQKDSSLVRGTISTEQGTYILENIKAGNYLLSFSMLGYQTIYSDAIKLGNNPQEINRGTIQLLESTTELGEVEVTARKPLFEQKIDRTVVNVQNSITSAGSTALDVLERSPGVVVNRQNSTLAMGGKEGVIVMINNKISRMPISAVVQMLEGMNASNIEKIELITTPPASFDAEGDAGIINIILKKSTDEGINGTYGVTGGYGGGAKWGANTNFNYRTKKFNLFGDYSYFHTIMDQLFVNQRTVTFENQVSETLSNSFRDPFRTLHNGRLGFDFYLDDRTIIGGLLSGYDNNWDMDAFNEVIVKENGTISSTIGIDNSEINHWQHLMGNFNVQHNFSKEESLNFNLDYLYYHDNNPTNYTNNYFDASGNPTNSDQLRVGKITPIKIWVAKADYAKKLGEKFKLEAGLKGTFTRLNNDVRVENLIQNVWVVDPELTQDSELREDIGAAYTSLDFQLNDNTSMKFGLRYEYTNSNLSTPEQANIVDREFGQLFPSFFVSHTINEHNTFQFSYSRRITRPTYNDMAPFVIFFDPNTFFSGNTAIQPATTHALRTEYKFKSYLIAVQYSRDNDPIARFQPRVNAERNQQIISATNLDNRHSISVSLSLPFYVTDWWEMQNNIMGIWQEVNFSAEGTTVSNSNKSLRFNGVQSFKLPKNFSFEISGFFQSAVAFGLQDGKALGTLNLGLQKKLKNGLGNIRIALNDVFSTGNWRSSINQPELNLNIYGEYNFSQRTIMVSYSRNFGNNKLKGSRRRSTGSEEERGRIQG